MLSVACSWSWMGLWCTERLYIHCLSSCKHVGVVSLEQNIEICGPTQLECMKILDHECMFESYAIVLRSRHRQ